MVIRGGENLYPREIEEVLIHHVLGRQIELNCRGGQAKNEDGLTVLVEVGDEVLLRLQLPLKLLCVHEAEGALLALGLTFCMSKSDGIIN